MTKLEWRVEPSDLSLARESGGGLSIGKTEPQLPNVKRICSVDKKHKKKLRRATKKKKEKSSVREENLRGALDKKEKDNSNNDNSESLTKIEKLLEDNQISRAYDLIRGIKLYGKKNSLNKKKLVNQNPHKNKIG